MLRDKEEFNKEQTYLLVFKFVTTKHKNLILKKTKELQRKHRATNVVDDSKLGRISVELEKKPKDASLLQTTLKKEGFDVFLTRLTGPGYILI